MSPRHPLLRDDLVDRLRTALGGAAGRTREAPAEPAPPGPGATAGAAEVAARARSLARRAARRAARPVLSRVEEVASARTDALDASVSARFELLKGEVRAALASTAPGAAEAQALRTDVQLLKGELRDLAERLERFGLAVAPGAGLGAVPGRMAELRERLDAIDRRVRRLAESGPAPAAEGAGAGDAPVGAAAPAASSGFDYVGFEHRFRGAASTVLEKLTERYAELLGAHAPVLDVGCGRGELLAALAERGIAGSGVDISAEMVDEARARGVDAHVGDAVDFLAAAGEGAYGSMIAVHVAEHLPLERLVAFLELAVTRLRPGGVLVLETPNPMSLIVLGNSYILDPTHVWPLHPSLLSFLCERAGFRDVSLRFYEPATDYHLPRLEGAPDEPWVAAVDEAIAKLNEVLFGPQEYAVVATTPPS